MRSRVQLTNRVCCLVLAFGLAGPTSGQETDTEPETVSPPVYSIKGYGLLGNLRVKRMVQALDDEVETRETFGASFLEDSALIILSKVSQDGFLDVVVEASITRADGSVLVHEFTESGFESLPRPMIATEVVYRIEPGIRYHYDEIRFEGLTRVTPKKAIGFFQVSGVLLNSKKDRLFTPAGLRRGLFSLVESLRRLGHREATAVASEVDIDRESGKVRVVITVEEGRRTVIRESGIDVSSPVVPAPSVEPAEPGPDQPYSSLWLQDAGLQIRRPLYEAGYADLTLRWRIEPAEDRGDDLTVDSVAEVETGPTIEVGQIHFEGLDRTHLPTVRRRINLQPGAPLNPFEIEESRRRLRRLGAFDSVTTEQVPVSDSVRDIVFSFEEGRSLDVSLLLGYGSYEQIRGGVQLNRYNIFGRAHRSRLKLIQSMKSTNADYTYSVPEIFGENIDGNLRFYGLRREEISFTRLEAGASAGLRRFFKPIDTDLAVSYNFEFLGTRDSELPPDETPDDAIAATIRFDATHDKRDNPLMPRAGYRLYGESETSSRYLGATVDYQRFQFSVSWHRPVTEGFWVHLGLKHGMVIPHDRDEDFPVNKRFFPGGENTVRGYVQGEAAPRDADGVVIGAESSFVANVELEVALSTSIALIGFLDSTFNAALIEDYPANEGLYSVGLGLRYNTVVGPIRLEYGHNLNPRELDPDGTLHFSIGFPF
jgi:outer membrane protein assembly factor BamA